MKNIFNSIKLTRPKNNVFDLSHDVKLSCNMGELVPVMITECVPGDHFNIGCETLIRFAPLVAPVMHRIDVTIHYFFVPNRILWPNWENFITQTKVGSPAAVPAFPTISLNDGNYSSGRRISDYLGIPPAAGLGTSEVVSALPYFAYGKIFNEYYRDQNLVTPVLDLAVDGDNSTPWEADYDNFLFKRAWEHDYFTASLPFAQKGASVDIPLGNVLLNPAGEGNPGGVFVDDTNYASNPTGSLGNTAGGIVAGIIPVTYDPKGTLEVEATTINELRRAFRLQEWLEKNARGGTRYIEHIKVHFGVQSSDKRLQRPEYITGSKSPVIISEVLNTTGTTDAPQGGMAGHGISVNAGKYGKYFCEEHGYIMGIMSIMPKTAYQQGIPKHWLKTSDAFQYYYPSFAHLGEQEVLNREIMAWQTPPYGDNTFGYVPRYAEYKYEPNRVAGDFRSSLAFWHMGRIFSTPPALNSDFVTSDPRKDIFAVTAADTDTMFVQHFNRIRAVRPMPVFGTPRL